MVHRILAVLATSALLLTATSCAPEQQTVTPDEPMSYDTTIGQLGQTYQFRAVHVRGYGLVAGLPGTGSSECPPDLRAILSKDILANIKGDVKIRPDDLINGLDTAVVEVFGTIPPVASKGDRFDLKVVAVATTQTTSLAGGTLYPTELKAVAGLVSYDQFAPVLGKATGPIFMDTTDPTAPKTTAYILGGGTATEGVRLAIGLNKPDFVTAAAVRNRINERFGAKTAKAISPGEIEFVIPDRYKEQKEKFLSMLNHLYMAEDFELRKRRIEMLVARLAAGTDMQSAEYALDAIGRPALDALAPLLDSTDEEVRFHAARCALSIGDDRALPPLRAFINDPASPYRLQAINAVGRNAKRDQAIIALGGLLSDNDFKVRFAAYERLLALQDVSVSRRLVGGKFFVDQIARKGPPVVYVSRSGVPRIVLFGAPILCQENIFLESDQRDIVLNAPAGAQHVAVMRKLPNRPRLVGPLEADYDVSDIIRTLCEDPATSNLQLRKGLGASYTDVTALLAKMVHADVVKAAFVAGDMTAAGAFLQKAESVAR